MCVMYVEDEFGLKTSASRLFMGIDVCKEQISYSIFYCTFMQV